MACGVAWVAGEAILPLEILNLNLSHAVGTLTGVFLALGAMVAVASLHILQRGRYGWWGTIFSFVAFVGLLLAFNGGIRNFFQTVFDRDAPIVLQYLSLDIYMDEFSLLIASIGIVGLGVVTIVGRVLPWWCGVALIAGSPVALVVEYLLLEPLLWALWPTGPNPAQSIIPMMLLAVPWIVVGYAIFRAGARLSEPLSRVR